MGRLSPHFVCQKCGFVSLKWMGCCESCGTWNSFVEETETEVKSKKRGSALHFASLKEAKTQPIARMTSDMPEFDRVLGGGVVPGSVVLLGGDPGIGKSTLLLQITTQLAQKFPCAYISGEEGIDQIRLRGRRLDMATSPLKLASTTSVADVIKSIEQEHFSLVIIDSIQTMSVQYTDAPPGTVSQIRAASNELIRVAKKSGVAMFFVGHVTKEGHLAGPRLLEHMVDTVLYFEGEKGHPFRILRAQKNRFGPTDEIGVFDMSEKGLREVKNPSELFLSQRLNGVAGSAVFAGVEGSRPLLAEIQALASPSHLPAPRRSVVGWDAGRLAMVLAILESRAGMNVSQKDIYLNVLGGLKLTEPATDVAVAAAILSCLLKKPLPLNTVMFGELSLSGEIRPVSRADARLKEAEKLGFKEALLPAALIKGNQSDAMTLRPLTHVKDLVHLLEAL